MKRTIEQLQSSTSTFAVGFSALALIVATFTTHFLDEWWFKIAVLLALLAMFASSVVEKLFRRRTKQDK